MVLKALEVPFFSIKSLRGFSKLRRGGEDLELEFEIPVSSELIDCINEIRRRKRVVGFYIPYSFYMTQLGYTSEISSLISYMEKILPDGERRSVMPFSTEEIDELMEKLNYIRFIRFEVPVPLIPETQIEILEKSATELKSVEEELTKGNYPEALRILRNIIMNYLTEKKNGERVLKGAIREYITSNVPSNYKDIYEEILNGIENTLVSNLKHVHKFIKEETGKVIFMPSREDAEYVYFMLASILRYISQLTITWQKE